MSRFLLREIPYSNIHVELAEIGFDSLYLDVISEKFRYKNIKIYGLSTAQANILKQTALIFGADCAVNRNVVTGKIETSDVILCGSYSQLQKIVSKLKRQPFKLAMLAGKIQDFLNKPAGKTKITGILNVTPDSFSDGGLYLKPEDAQRKLISLIEDGADMIDIGAESTKPYSVPVAPEEQIARLKPILSFIINEGLTTKISIDTRSSAVADFALNNGAHLINDVSGFEFDNKMANVISRYNAGVIIQHSKDKAENTPVYKNVVDEIFLNLKDKINFAREAGINDIIIDPGIGFGKSREDNFKILENIQTFYSLECPVMVGISRKRLLHVQDAGNDIKDAFTLAYSYPLMSAGVDFLRVHNVKLHKLFLNSLPT